MQGQNIEMKKAQKEFLEAFSKKAKNFALAGGTALELFYLHHRFSVDLDFFSPKYNVKEIEAIISEFKNIAGCKIKLENEFILAGAAKARFYYAELKKLNRPLKIDFVEDVIFDEPRIKRFNGIPVYSVENIYLQKIIAITGTMVKEDQIGRQIMEGRRQARDAFDVYMLSKKIKPLHIFLKTLSSQIQRGMVHWYQTFSRQDLNLGLLDMDIYGERFDARKMVVYLESEIRTFIKEVMGK